MRANEFIVEYDIAHDEIHSRGINYDQLVDAVTKRCGPYLAEVGGIENALFNTPLYRGIKSFDTKNKPVAIIPTRTDRRPLDTPDFVHHAVNEWLLDNTGYKFRSESQFVTGEIGEAQAYGDVYVVLPIGDYKYCWSPVYTDLFVSAQNAAQQEWFNDKANKSLPPNSTPTIKEKIINLFGTPEKVDEFMAYGNYKTNLGLKNAIRHGNEIMIMCPGIIAISCRLLDDFQDEEM